jgi:uncharacterized membrane protein
MSKLDVSQLQQMSDGYYHRGAETTRLEAFVDASFAFSLSVLVIAGNNVPDSVEQLFVSLKAIPAFAASFLLITQFWRSHSQWSRRFGLDDDRSQWLSLLLIFFVLIFIYPTHMVFSSLFDALSGGYLPIRFIIKTLYEFRALFVVFGLAFFCMGATISMMYRHALTKAAELGLSDRELLLTRLTIRQWDLVVIVSLFSILLACFMPESTKGTIWMGTPGFIYFTLNICGFWFARKQRQILSAA